MHMPVRSETIKAGILRLTSEVMSPAPNNMSALMVPASDFISRDVIFAADFMSVFDARFHCISRF